MHIRNVCEFLGLFDVSLSKFALIYVKKLESYEFVKVE